MSMHLINPADLRVRDTFEETDLLLMWNPVSDTALPYPITLASLRASVSPTSTVVAPTSVTFDHLAEPVRDAINSSIRSLTLDDNSLTILKESGAQSELQLPGLTVENADGLLGSPATVITLALLGPGVSVTRTGNKVTATIASGGGGVVTSDLRPFSLANTSDADTRRALAALTQR